MGTRKVYISTSGVELSFSAQVKEQRVLITFKGENATFSTVNDAIQKRIESRPDYGSGIKLLRIIEDEGGKGKRKEVGKAGLEDGQENQYRTNEPEKEPVVNETADWQEAKDFLMNEPYCLKYQALTTPERILAKAQEHGVAFPNLQLV